MSQNTSSGVSNSDDSGIEPISADGVSGFLHRPPKASTRGLVLTHGAGANCQTPLLISVARSFASAGYLVLRCDLPFRQLKRFGPPFPAQAERDRQGLKKAAELLRSHDATDIFLGGHSYGGRQASMLLAEDSSSGSGLLLLSYPLHPPDKPAQDRTAHFPALDRPCFFVHGSRDPFGTIQELERAVSLIPGPTKLHTLTGAGHDLAKGKFDTDAVAGEFTVFEQSGSSKRKSV